MSVFARDSSDMPVLDIMDQQDEIENEAMMESLSDQIQSSQDSPVVGWVKYQTAKIYSRYLICRVYASKKVEAMIKWVKHKKQVLLPS